MKLVLRRDKLLPDRTLGTLRYGSAKFYTLEDQVRPDPVIETAVNEAKVMHATAIPEGEYRVILDYSPRFGRVLPHVLDVPGFVGIRIHPGNTPKDTSGCILVGTRVAADNTVRNSQAAFAALFSMMERAYDVNEEITLVVTSRSQDEPSRIDA